MGYIKHHSVIVTGDEKQISKARKKCLKIFRHELEETDNPENIISPIMSGLVNGQYSFFIAPDGSKEYWTTSDNCDNAREIFIQWLKEKTHCDYIEIHFGGDDYENSILKHRKND